MSDFFSLSHLLISHFGSVFQPPLRPSLVCWSLTARRKLWRFLLFSTTTRSGYRVSLSERHLSYKHKYTKCPHCQEACSLNIFTPGNKITHFPFHKETHLAVEHFSLRHMLVSHIRHYGKRQNNPFNGSHYETLKCLQIDCGFS